MRYKISAIITGAQFAVGTLAGQQVIVNNIDFYVDVDNDPLPEQITSLASVVSEIMIVESTDAVIAHRARLVWETWLHKLIADSKEYIDDQEYIFEALRVIDADSRIMLTIDPVV